MLALAGGVLAATAMSSDADTPTADQTTDYAITLAGLPLAHVSFSTHIDGSRFRIEGRFATSGLARLVRKLEGTAGAEGRLSGGAFDAQTFYMHYKLGGAPKAYDVGFANGGISSVSMTPKRDKYPDGWIALAPADMARAVDPIAGLILPAKANLCDGALPIFDGEARSDLVLTDKGERAYKAGGQTLNVRVCGFSLQPKSGYRKGKSDLEWVSKLKGMEIWFARSPIADVYAPVKIVAPTGFGSFVISATRFGA